MRRSNLARTSPEINNRSFNGHTKGQIFLKFLKNQNSFLNLERKRLGTQWLPYQTHIQINPCLSLKKAWLHKNGRPKNLTILTFTIQILIWHHEQNKEVVKKCDFFWKKRKNIVINTFKKGMLCLKQADSFTTFLHMSWDYLVYITKNKNLCRRQQFEKKVIKCTRVINIFTVWETVWNYYVYWR